MSKIEINDLCIAYENKTIFSHFDFFVEDKEIVGIFSPSGSGKTTLLNYISQNYNSVSYAYQDLRLLENITVFKNLEIPLNKMTKNDARTKILELLKELHIEDKKNQRIKELSGGERQLVSLARALLYNSEILLLDECFNSLDENKKNIALEVTKKQLNINPRTTIIVSHNKKDLVFLCNRIQGI